MGWQQFIVRRMVRIRVMKGKVGGWGITSRVNLI